MSYIIAIEYFTLLCHVIKYSIAIIKMQIHPIAQGKTRKGKTRGCIVLHLSNTCACLVCIAFVKYMRVSRMYCICQIHPRVLYCIAFVKYMRVSCMYCICQIHPRVFPLRVYLHFAQGKTRKGFYTLITTLIHFNNNDTRMYLHYGKTRMLIWKER